MADKPRKIKELRNLRIDEVSFVDRGAGEQCKVVISKRDDHHESEPVRKHLLFNDIIKSFAADARGDEADDHDEETSADELAGDNNNEHHASKVADLLVESGSHETRKDALAYLLHHPRGVAMLRRLNKKDSTMPTNAEVHALAKKAGVIEIAKRLVEAGDPFEVTEEQLVDLISKHERRDGESEAQCFARHFEARTEEGVLFREAIKLAKAAEVAKAEVEKMAEAAPVYDPRPRVVTEANVDDPAEAIRQLKELGRRHWPDASEAEQFERAFTDPANAGIAARTYIR